MLFSRHNETATKPWWYPRHPGVTEIDVLGAISSIYWLVISPHWTTTVYCCILIMLYSVSAIYHHAQYRNWLGKLDHITIFYVIAITALPFWSNIMPFTWYGAGPLLILAICLIGTLVKIVSFLPRYVSGFAYVIASVPMVSYFATYQNLVPMPERVLWPLGVALYGIQLGVYTLEKPDPLSKQFGYREIQHTILLCATNVHCWIYNSLA